MNPAAVTPTTLNTIRRNAGKLPPSQIAYDLGWPLKMLERVARERQIDLALRAERAERSVISESNQRYTEQVGVRFSAHDFDLLEALSRKLGIPRGQVVRRVIENARAQGMLFELAKLPAPLPEPPGNLDGEE